jgi:putative cell wall-binding protein
VGVCTGGVPAPPAGAEAPAAELQVVNDATNVADALDVPTIAPGTSGAARGLDLVLAPGAAFAAGEEVSVAVSDADGGDVAFAGAPSVLVTGGAAAGEVSLAPSGDRLVVRLGAVAAGAGRLRIRNVRYDVAPGAARGPVVVTARYRGRDVVPAVPAGVPATVATNAYLSDVATGRGAPAPGVAAGGPGAAVVLPPLVIAESRPGALGPPLGRVAICVRRSDGGRLAGAGAAVVAGGTAVVAAPAAVVGEAADTVRFELALGLPGAPRRVALVDAAVPADAPGLVALRAGPCDGGAPFGPDVTMAAVTRLARLGGSTRWATAARLSEALAGDLGAPVAVLARGDDFADALAAAYLAARSGPGRPAPLLLTPPDELPQAVLNALRRMGTKTVVVVGGPFAVAPEVTAALDAAPAWEVGGTTPALVCPERERTDGTCTLAVERIYGPDRWATAAAIARVSEAPGTVDLTPADGVDRPLRTAFVARGDDFADALAVAPLAAAGAGGGNGDGAPIPLLLTARDRLPPVTLLTMAALGVEQVVVVGGPAAVDEGVAAELAGAGLTVVRVGGRDRQETAGKLATLAVTPADRGGFGFPTGAGAGRGELVIARGDAFADALAFGPWCGARRAPLVLTAGPGELGEVARAFLDATAWAFARLTVAGGPDAVRDDVVAAALSAKTGTLIP